MDIKIYTTPTCGYCHQAKQYLRSLGIPYVEHDISMDRQAANEMVQATGQMGVPVIVVNGRAIVGFNRPLLDELLSTGQKQRHQSFGLGIADASKFAPRAGVQFLSGAYIGKVAPASPGNRAGLQPGDVITDVNGNTVNTAADLEHILAGLNTGSRVSIIFRRREDARQSEIIL